MWFFFAAVDLGKTRRPSLPCLQSWTCKHYNKVGMGEVTVSCCCTAAFLQGLVWWGFAFSISIIFFLQCRFPSHFPPSLVCFHSKTGRSSPFFFQVSFQWISFNRLKTFECNCKKFAGPWSMLCKSVANTCLEEQVFLHECKYPKMSRP